MLRDDLGAFGNPSADSLRACVDKSSRDILQVLFFYPEDPRQQAVLAATLAAFNEFFTMTESRSFIIGDVSQQKNNSYRSQHGEHKNQ